VEIKDRRSYTKEGRRVIEERRRYRESGDKG
jgi:ribosomal protein L34